MRIHVGHRRLALAIVAAVGLAGGASAASEPIDVTIDFAKIVKLPGPAHTIIVGNPGIADALVDDEQTLVLTGKTAGTTNLIVLDAEGAEVVNSVVRVSSDVQQLTTIFYGGSENGVWRQTFSCAPVCEQVISVGDAKERFETATTQIQTRKDFATGK